MYCTNIHFYQPLLQTNYDFMYKKRKWCIEMFILYLFDFQLTCMWGRGVSVDFTSGCKVFFFFLPAVVRCRAWSRTSWSVPADSSELPAGTEHNLPRSALTCKYSVKCSNHETHLFILYLLFQKSLFIIIKGLVMKSLNLKVIFKRFWLR